MLKSGTNIIDYCLYFQIFFRLFSVFIERFLQFIENKGLTLHKVERELGLSNGYLGKQRDRKGSIGSDIIEKIVEHYPDLDVRWLLTGQKSEITPTVAQCNTCREKDLIIEMKDQIITKNDEVIATQKQLIAQAQDFIDHLKKDNNHK